MRRYQILREFHLETVKRTCKEHFILSSVTVIIKEVKGI